MSRLETAKIYMEKLKQISIETNTIFKPTGSRVFDCAHEGSDWDIIMDSSTIPKVIADIVYKGDKPSLYSCSGGLMWGDGCPTPALHEEAGSDYFQQNGNWQPFGYLNLPNDVKFNILFMDKETQKEWIFATDMVTEMLDHPSGFGILEDKIGDKETRVALFESLKKAVRHD